MSTSSLRNAQPKQTTILEYLSKKSTSTPPTDISDIYYSSSQFGKAANHMLILENLVTSALNDLTHVSDNLELLRHTFRKCSEQVEDQETHSISPLHNCCFKLYCTENAPLERKVNETSQTIADILTLTDNLISSVKSVNPKSH